MIELLVLIGWSMFGSIVAVGFTEVAAIYAATEYGWNPLIIGIICALSQFMVHIGLYYFGDWMAHRWQWLGQRMHAARERWKERLDRGYITLSALGSIIGTPPVVAMIILAPGFEIKMAPLLGTILAGRTIRFTGLAYFGNSVIHWFTS